MVLCVLTISRGIFTCADPCPPYSIDAVGNHLCRYCPGGRVTPTSSTGDLIPPWRADQEYACGECPAGQYRGETQHTSTCTECPIGQYSVGGQANCSTCDRSSVTNINATGASSCIQCPGGKGPVATRSGCNECPLRTASNAGVCSPCGGDTVPNLETAATACVQCPSGKGPASSGSTCEDCGEGLFSAQGV